MADHGATRFVNRRSRLVVDPERLLDPAAEPTEALGQGAVYTRTSDGRALRTPDPAAREALIDAFYRPYHDALDATATDLVEAFGSCTLLDCHSFPTVPLPSELDQAPDRPDICIGRDPLHTPDELAEPLADAFRAEGLSVAVDRPFAGTMVPGAFFGRDTLRSVMIEVRRGLYMDEATGDIARLRGDQGAARARWSAPASSTERSPPDMERPGRRTGVPGHSDTRRAGRRHRRYGRRAPTC